MTTSGVALFWAVVTAVLLVIMTFDMLRLWRVKSLVGEARRYGPIICLVLLSVFLIDVVVASSVTQDVNDVVPATGVGLVVTIAMTAFVGVYHLGVRHELKQYRSRR